MQKPQHEVTVSRSVIETTEGINRFYYLMVSYASGWYIEYIKQK